MTRASTPGSLSTRTAIVWRSVASVISGPRAFRPPAARTAELQSRPSHEHHALLRDRALRLVLGAEQHLVMGCARGDHREAVLGLIDGDVEDHLARRLDHLADRAIDLLGPLDAEPDRAKRLRELD